jgi:hypothetical protein
VTYQNELVKGAIAMPKYVAKIVNRLIKALTLRQLELLAAWIKNTDPQVVQYHLVEAIEAEIREAKHSSPIAAD